MKEPTITITGTKSNIIGVLGGNGSEINDHIQQIMLTPEQEQMLINTVTRQINQHPTSSLTREQVAQMITESTKEFITASKLTIATSSFVRRSQLEQMLNDYVLKSNAFTKQAFLNYTNSDIFKKYIKSIIPIANEEYKKTRLGKENDIMDIYVYQMKHCLQHNQIPYYVEIREGKELFHPILWVDETNDVAMYLDWDNKWKPIGLTSGETTMLSAGEYIIT